MGGREFRQLSYADDLVLVAESPIALQRLLDRLSEFCREEGMIVNTEKSKVMVFRRGGRVGRQHRWWCSGQVLENVSAYCYLGVWLSATGDVAKHGGGCGL